MSNKFKFADSVSMRMIQIFQEAAIFGVDGADLFRQVRLQPSEDNPEVLVMTPEYEQQVQDMHAKYEEDLKKLQANRAPKLILGGDGNDNN